MGRTAPPGTPNTVRTPCSFRISSATFDPLMVDLPERREPPGPARRTPATDRPRPRAGSRRGTVDRGPYGHAPGPCARYLAFADTGSVDCRNGPTPAVPPVHATASARGAQ